MIAEEEKKADLQRLAKILLLGGLGGFTSVRLLCQLALWWTGPESALGTIMLMVLAASVVIAILCVIGSATVLVMDRCRRRHE